MYKKIYFILLVLLTACSSGSGDDQVDAILPSDLLLSINIVGADTNNPDGDGSGVIECTATGSHVVKYGFEFGDSPEFSGSAEIENVAGVLGHTYSREGTNTYTVTVKAYSTTGHFASFVKDITVFVGTPTEPPIEEEQQLVWSDEFDGSALDATKWTFDIGGGGWGNNESQVYTSEQSNVKVEDGVLKINALKESGNAATYYFDELNLLDSGDNIVSTVEDFEGAVSLNPFDGATSQVVDNPDMSGENTTPKVAEFVKHVGSNGNAGVFWDISNAVDLSVNNKLSLKTWSPATGVVVRLKLENSADGSEFHLVDALTTVSSAWETLTYDFSGAPAYNYDRLVVFYDHGTTIAEYTSGRIKTENLYDFTYGTVKVRAKLPGAEGTWPAIWMLGDDFSTAGWPTCGEIDIMEQTGWAKSEYISTLHWSNNGNYASYGTSSPGSHGENFSVPNSTSQFHEYTLEWTESSLTFYVDEDLDNKFVIDNNSGLPFDHDFFLILNIAMGGNLGGTIDPNFTESTMEVDYVRVYQ